MTIIVRLKCLFFIVFFSLASNASYNVKVACYYNDSEYVYLTDSSNKVLTFQADFDNKSYSLLRGSIVGAQKACQKKLGATKTLTKTMAVNATTSSITGDYLGYHYDLSDIKTDALIAKYKKRFSGTDAFEEFSVSIDFKEDNDSKSFLQKIQSILVPSANEKEYVNRNMEVDLPRSDTEVYDNQTRVYSQANKKIEIRNRLLNQVNDLSYSVEPFKVIAGIALDETPSLNILSLRKGIAKAIFTRMQAFWFDSLYKVRSYMIKDLDDNAEVQISAARSLNTFKVKGQMLEIESTQTFFVKIVTEDGVLEAPVGQFKGVRNSTMDLSTGEFVRSSDGKNERIIIIAE